MIIGVPKETHPGEQRVALLPASIERLVKKGASVHLEQGLGATVYKNDEEYKKAGAKVTDRASILSSSDPPLAQAAAGRNFAPEKRRHPHQFSRPL